jgi:hypothetical protein
MNSISPYCAFVEPSIPQPAVLPFAATWLFILAVFSVFLWWATDASHREADMEQNVTYVKTTLEGMRTIVEENVKEVKASLDVLKEVTAENPRMEAMACALDMFLEERIKQCQDEKACLERNRDMYKEQLASIEGIEDDTDDEFYERSRRQNITWQGAFSHSMITQAFFQSRDYETRKAFVEKMREPVRVNLRPTETALALRNERIEQFGAWRRVILTPDG